ncbi:MAG: hypothetical protein IT223_05630 [Crocinitomicaceae bacterium]|nr:hypothetical protein [Crocinitomicaceae bacterium]
MRNFLTIFSLLVFFLILTVRPAAQGTLQFSQALIVTTSQTVPTGKVWKVTSLYGSEDIIGECVSLNTPPLTTSVANRLRCAYKNNTWKWIVVDYSASLFKVNGTPIASQITGLGDGIGLSNWTGTTCGDGSNTSRTANWSCANLDSDPNIFPMWLPAGTTLESGGSKTFVSVLEFNIIP